VDQSHGGSEPWLGQSGVDVKAERVRAAVTRRCS
jgi:hypothetical protein